MERNLKKLLNGYQAFRKKYASGDQSIMQSLAYHGQKPHIMAVACCDSRVDPGLILQCEPGELFVVRNVANIVPPYEKDEAHHGTSAALEFGVRFLKVSHLILLGHSQCGGVSALFDNNMANPGYNDFVSNWVSLINPGSKFNQQYAEKIDDYAKLALHRSYQNCLSFPWIQERVMEKKLFIHLWFFDIKAGEMLTYSNTRKEYQPLDSADWLEQTCEHD